MNVMPEPIGEQLSYSWGRATILCMSDLSLSKQLLNDPPGQHGASPVKPAHSCRVLGGRR